MSEAVDRCDIVLRGGTVVDPAQDLCGVRDVGVAGGRIVEVAEDLSGSSRTRL